MCGPGSRTNDAIRQGHSGDLRGVHDTEAPAASRRSFQTWAEATAYMRSVEAERKHLLDALTALRDDLTLDIIVRNRAGYAIHTLTGSEDT